MRPTMSAISELTSEYAPGMAQTRLDIEKEFGPQMAELYNQMLQQANPEFMSTYGALGEKVRSGLEAGYELGPELGTEVQQAIRAAQTARGNWLGGAPTAQEAFGMGSAAISLYNQRLGTAQNFLNSKQPTDMWGALQATSSYMPMSATFPQGSYPNAALSTDVFGTLSQSRSAYNATAANAYGTYVGAQSANYGTYVTGLDNAAGINNQSAFDRYSAQFDQFLYGQSVQQGLYSQPSARRWRDGRNDGWTDGRDWIRDLSRDRCRRSRGRGNRCHRRGRWCRCQCGCRGHLLGRSSRHSGSLARVPALPLHEGTA